MAAETLTTYTDERRACQFVAALVLERKQLNQALADAAFSTADEFKTAEDRLADFDADHPWLAEVLA